MQMVHFWDFEQNSKKSKILKIFEILKKIGLGKEYRFWFHVKTDPFEYVEKYGTVSEMVHLES